MCLSKSSSCAKNVITLRPQWYVVAYFVFYDVIIIHKQKNAQYVNSFTLVAQLKFNPFHSFLLTQHVNKKRCIPCVDYILTLNWVFLRS